MPRAEQLLLCPWALTLPLSLLKMPLSPVPLAWHFLYCEHPGSKGNRGPISSVPSESSLAPEEKKESESVSHSVVYDPLQLHGL